MEIAAAASAVADGDVTSVDARRDGSWEVTLETAAGVETDVVVSTDGTATVAETDPADQDDSGPIASLDEATIRALVAAALAEAEGLTEAEALITEIDVDDDAARPYDVSVALGANRSIEIDFDASFTVIGTDLDG